MGSIIARKRKDGTTAYLAQIVVKKSGGIVHRENKTFPAKREAAGWIARREEAIERELPGAAEVRHTTLAAVIQRYTDESLRDLGRTKKQVLKAITASNLAQKRCSDITSRDVLAYAQDLLSGNRKPQTVLNYLSHLSSVFAIAKPAWGYPLDHQAMQDAMAVAKRLGVTRKSGERDRRPTLDELDRVLTHFAATKAKRPDSNPMVDIVLFGLFSTRRQEEITRITWADLDVEHSRVLVRDMKHPGDKMGNDQWVDLPPEAMAVVQRQPRNGARIFPASTDAISAAFTRACKMLSIEDLHFHDLRHEGISRLFEMGWSIPHVAAVSGHRSWQSLKRYTHVRQRGDKYAGWKWIDGVPDCHGARQD